MTETVISEPSRLYPGQVGYSLVAFISPATQARIATLLQPIIQQLPGVIAPAPSEGLHITLCEIIQLKPYKQDKAVLFARHQHMYEQVPGDVLRHRKPIAIRFTLCEASPAAIIIRGQDDGSFASLRRQLAQKLPLPAETKAPPEIVHATIARYSQAVDLSQITALLPQQPLVLEEIVQEFALVRVTVARQLEFETLKVYRLM
jgi:2'-5' RNA ligase